MKRASGSSRRKPRQSTSRRRSGSPASGPGILAEGNVLVRVDPTPAAPAGDRRRSERHSESATGWLSNAHGGSLTSGRSVTICNLSLHGVGFTTHRPCQVGDRHWILILQGAMRLSTRVRVVSVQKLGAADEWTVGAEFF